MESKHFFAHWKQDLPASVVVFLVALPLCLGIALASGAPLISGLIAGVVGGIVVGLASGSSLGVSGPAAGLAAIVLAAISDLGTYELFLAAVVVAGLVQVGLGLLKAGVIAYYFPNAVIKGMLSGIGVIIILKQIPHAVGYDADYMGDQDFLQRDQHNTITELFYMMDAINPGALVITLVGLVLMVLWERPFIKRNPVLNIVPGPLLAVLAGIGLAITFTGTPMLEVGAGHYVDIPDLSSFAALPRLDLAGFLMPKVWVVALTIAVVASIETLLSVEATDKLDPYKRTTPANRELIAQGAGNLISGLIGGMPVTQVIVRSSANIQTGGRTRLSAIAHGFLLLGCVLLLPGLLRMIPLASLAAVLLLVGYKLVKPAQIKRIYQMGIMQFLPYVVTVLGVAFTDLLTGVGLGIAVAFIHILWKNFETPFHFDPEDHQLGEPIRIELSEDVTFLNKASIKHTLEMLPAGSEVIIDARRSVHMHPDVLEIIEDFESIAPNRVIQVTTIGVHTLPQRRMVTDSAQKMVAKAANRART
ncbi:MAG: SulP family inorganic anion transporter [Flavobacteriales bacterium]|nr:SulP family inorganic anion transporter [Flavobacteriales bacterium]